MSMLVEFSIVSRMFVLVGAVISLMFMDMHMGLPLVFMLVLMALFHITVGMFVFVLMGMRIFM